MSSKIDSGSKLLLQAKIYSKIIEDQKKAKDIYEYIIMKHPNFIEAFHSYWRFLQKKKNDSLIT